MVVQLRLTEDLPEGPVRLSGLRRWHDGWDLSRCTVRIACTSTVNSSCSFSAAALGRDDEGSAWQSFAE
jgi:hypothetical protein